MVFRLIEKGTVLDIEIADKLTGQTNRIKGEHYDIVKETVLLIESEMLYGYCASKEEPVSMTVTFYRGKNEYMFEARCDHVMIKNDRKLTEVTALSSISEAGRRATNRFGMLLDVELFERDDTGDVKPLFVGQSYDISCDSLGIWANFNIEQDDRIYFTKFTLFHKDTFNIPAKLLRKKNAPKSSFYRYDYVFMFDYSEGLQSKKKLLDEFIINSLAAIRGQ